MTVTADELGPMAEHVERAGIDVAPGDDLPAECDVVLVHDSIVTGALADRYPGAGVVHCAHGDRFDHDLPVLVPGVVDAVVVLSDLAARRVEALPLGVPVVRLRHPIDTERFADAGPIRSQPRRALILSNYLRGERREALMQAWDSHGVEWLHIGAPAREELDPVAAIGEADIVVAKARAALEGMSCARAVYVYDEFGGDGWVTPAAYPALEAGNFGGIATPVRGQRDLEADLTAYDPGMGRQNRDLVRTHHSARRHAAQLVEVMRAAAPEVTESVTLLRELSRLTRLNWDSERRTIAAGYELHALRQRLHAAEAALEEAERGLAEAQRVLGSRRIRAGLAAGRAVDRLRGRR